MLNDMDTETEFELTTQITEACNSYLIVHIYNRSNVYHLTKQVLMDSYLTQNTYCFFYHILTVKLTDFNKMYGAFACLIEQNLFEANLYLNVNMDALEYIVNYIQTGKINEKYFKNQNMIDETIDLSIIFGMPKLVAILRNFKLPQTNEKFKESFKDAFVSLMLFWKNILDQSFNPEDKMKDIMYFIDENPQWFSDDSHEKDDFIFKTISLFGQIFIPSLNNLRTTQPQKMNFLKEYFTGFQRQMDDSLESSDATEHYSVDDEEYEYEKCECAKSECDILTKFNPNQEQENGLNNKPIIFNSLTKEVNEHFEELDKMVKDLHDLIGK